MQFSVDLGKIVGVAFSLILSGAALYVRGEVKAGLAAVQRELLARIDGIREGIQAINVTLARSEERHNSLSEAFEKMEERIERLEAAAFRSAN
jgi:BMFP domain-containing protein YqiC